MHKVLLTVCGGLLLAGVSLAQDANAPASASASQPPQDQQTPAPAPDAQPTPETAAPTPRPEPQPAAAQPAGQAGTPNSASGTPRIAPGSVIPVQLTKGVDAKKAKTGDEVVAKVTQDMKTNSGEVIVPKDTRMIGHVTEAQARSKDNKQSQVGISFDRAVMKNGSEVSLPMSIQAIIAPPTSNPGNGGPSNEQPAPAPAGAAGGMARGSSPAPPAAPSAADSTAPTDAQAGAARPQITGQTQGVVGISNLSLSAAPDATLGSMVSSEKNNVKLDSGVLMLLRVN